AWQLQRLSLLAGVGECDHHGEPAASIASPCATTRPALARLPGTLVASKGSRPRYDPLPGGPHGPSLPGQTSLACTRFSHLLRRNKTWDSSISVPTVSKTSGYRLKRTQQAIPTDDICIVNVR